MGTYEQKVHIDQFWLLEESQIHRGYYHIYNLKYDGYRVAQREPGTKEAGSYDGHYYDDQLWKFEDAGGMYA